MSKVQFNTEATKTGNTSLSLFKGGFRVEFFVAKYQISLLDNKYSVVAW